MNCTKTKCVVVDPDCCFEFDEWFPNECKNGPDDETSDVFHIFDDVYSLRT